MKSNNTLEITIHRISVLREVVIQGEQGGLGGVAAKKVGKKTYTQYY